MRVILRPAAAADVEDAISWYERQRPVLGTEFLEAVNAALKVIAQNRGSHRSSNVTRIDHCCAAFRMRFTTASKATLSSWSLACMGGATPGAGVRAGDP